MKKFIITLLSGLALSLSGFVFAGGTVVEAPTAEDNPAAQVAPVVKEEVADVEECDAETADCDKEETATAPETTDSPAQVAPAAETSAS